jgi:hypothetical protein
LQALAGAAVPPDGAPAIAAGFKAVDIAETARLRIGFDPGSLGTDAIMESDRLGAAATAVAVS